MLPIAIPVVVLLVPPAVVYAAITSGLNVTIKLTVAAPTILVTFEDFVLPFANSETATQVPKVAFQITL